jgi:hypothetical protein
MNRAVLYVAILFSFTSFGFLAQQVSGKVVPAAILFSQVTSSPAQGTVNAAQPSDSSSSSRLAATQTSASGQGSPTARDRLPATATASGTRGIQDSEGKANAATLPQTSTILPLLGLIGLGSLVAGLFARR